MIELEVFQRESDGGNHRIKIWVNGHLAFKSETYKHSDLVEIRNALSNELLWLNEYLGWEK